MAYSFYKAITIDHTKCGSGNSTDFPMYFSSTDVLLKVVGSGGHVENASGFDIAFFSNTSLTSALDHERIAFNGATGAFSAFVKVPSLSASVDTVIYLGYGDAGISTSQEDVPGTWNSNYKGVWHLDEGTGTTAADVTSNADTMTLLNSADWSTSPKLGASAFAEADLASWVGNGRQAHTTGTGNRVTNNGDWTVESWFKYGSAVGGGQAGSANYAFLGQWSGSAGWMVYGMATGAVRIYADRPLPAFATNSLPNNTNWHHVVGVKSGSNGILYVDGTSLGTTAIGTANFTTPALRMDLNGYDAGQNNANAAFDEIRLSNVARDASWVTSSYNNQGTVATFYTLGTEQTPSAASSAIPVIMNQYRQRSR